MKVAGIEIGGISVGGIETCIDLPGLKLAFDVGRCPREVVARPTVLFTHAHMDHMGGVAMHAATRALLGMPPPTYVVPRLNAADFDALFEVWRRLDGSELPYELVTLEPGEEYELPSRHFARPFRSPHRVWCQGYGLWERRRKLKPEHEGRPPDELRRLREAGEAITDEVEVCELAFTGDSSIDVVEREETVRRARVLVMEVTFLDGGVDVERSREMGHIHLGEVAERAELFENEALVLTHFSSRYSRGEIVKALDERLPAELRARVTPLLEGHKG